MLEAVASADIWIWHAFFGVAGSNNDINVLKQSPLFTEVSVFYRRVLRGVSQGRPAKNMGPVPNYTLGPQSNKANFEYLYIMLEHIFKIKSDVLIPFFF